MRLGLTWTDTGLMSLDETSVFRNSNRYTQKEDDTIVNSPYVLDDSLKTYETDLGTVHYDPKSLYMMFESKSGYLWSTAVYESAANINTEWRNKAKSIVTLNYYDTNGKAFSENLLTEDKKTKSKAVVTIKKENNSLNTHIVFALSKIEIDLIISFNENGFKIDIPFESIKDNDDFTFAYYMSTLSTSSNAVAGKGMAAAASLIMFMPNLIIFVFLQSRVMATMSHSGIK